MRFHLRFQPLWFRNFPVGALLTAGCLTLAVAAPCATRDTNVKADKALHDPRALLLLQQMTDAYSHVTTLDQTTEFFAPAIAAPTPDEDDDVPLPSATGTKLPPKRPVPTVQPDEKLPRGLRLRVARPNLLRLQVSEPGDSSEQAKVSEWCSDGKQFWTYTSDTHWYTQIKAPNTLFALAHLPRMTSGSLEMMMVLGENPFVNIQKQADSVTYEGTAPVHAAAADVVLLRSVSGPKVTEVRLFIGREDRFLYRVVIETVQQPTVLAQAGKVGDAFDELVDGVPPPPVAAAPAQPLKSHLAYENTFSPTRPVPADFQFQIPADAMRYNDFDKGSTNPYGRTDEDYFAVMQRQWSHPPKPPKGKGKRKMKKNPLSPNH